MFGETERHLWIQCGLSYGKRDSRWHICISSLVQRTNTGNTTGMRGYLDEGPEGLSVSDNNPKRLDWALDEGERIHLIVDLGPTFWAL